jgi:hypothetical protein
VILVPDLNDILKNATSDAERTVARLLSAVGGPQDAVAFHSVKLRSHAYKQQAESDFVILWNGVVVVAEVKGGGVSKHDGVWYTIDRHGDWHKLSSPPMEQARSAMYALRDILKTEGVGWFAHEAIVVTPDIDSPPHSVEWLPSHWLAKDDISIAGLTAALNAVTGHTKQALQGEKLARPDDLRTRLFGEFTRMPVIDAQRGAVIEEQNRATDDQARVLASLARNQRMMVLGGAGTGKSLLLVEAAKQESAAGRSVLITFESPMLLDFFTIRIEGREIDIVPFDDLTDEKAYDVVLVDEAQDLMTADAMDRLDTVILDGRAGGRWRMFMDPNNQAHIDGHFDSEVLELISAEAPSFDLNRNVRNTKSIVHMVQSYLGADVGDPGIVHGDKVRWDSTVGPADIQEATRIAKELVADGVRKADIWIISTGSSEAPFLTSTGITVTNPRFAKGLEAEHVVVCDLPETFDAAGVAALYVAVTRARVSLHLVVSPDDKKRLQGLVARQGRHQ